MRERERDFERERLLRERAPREHQERESIKTKRVPREHQESTKRERERERDERSVRTLGPC